MEMMKCMRANEYYDIMTAGTEEKYDAAEKATAKLESWNNQTENPFFSIIPLFPFW